MVSFFNSTNCFHLNTPYEYHINIDDMCYTYILFKWIKFKKMSEIHSKPCTHLGIDRVDRVDQALVPRLERRAAPAASCKAIRHSELTIFKFTAHFFSSTCTSLQLVVLSFFENYFKPKVQARWVTPEILRMSGSFEHHRCHRNNVDVYRSTVHQVPQSNSQCTENPRSSHETQTRRHFKQYLLLPR